MSECHVNVEPRFLTYPPIDRSMDQSGSNSYGDPTLNPMALDVTSNNNSSSSSPSKDPTKIRAELCRRVCQSHSEMAWRDGTVRVGHILLIGRYGCELDVVVSFRNGMI